ncbi:uncharacterized protein LOC110696917 [Chenopodium quinoa]|uniref:uncharacterized protein LOC110696917 n=1 Tax=Chenopodium quinoa TaxID=63459 RepID=UPI000B773241|nr:uncharacterized protein LOC110696917 [Chenopodium quinoa]
MPRNGPEYREGVNNFIQSSLNTSAFNGRIKYPCKRCAVTVYLDRKDVREHLFCVGFDKNYANSIWVFHGEEPSPSRVDDEVLSDEESNDGPVMIYDFPQAGEGETNLEVQKFHQLVQDAKTKLYPGCDKFTNLSFILRLHQMKCLYRWSDTSLNHMLQLLNDVLPNGSNLPKNLYQMKKIMADLGLGYTKIDACPNDCMLYWKEKVNDEKCNVCDVSRWKDPLIGKKSGPAKVLRHFPLIPRLKRLFMSRKTSKLMRWHKKGHSKDGKQRHPSDSLAWKNLDEKYPEFARDARNLRLGLASDGFNPFSNMSTNHSTCPVVLMVYNLPPWLCMKDSYFIMSLLISGPKDPGNDIDVYLQPLIDELMELWNGVETYDALTNDTFILRAALLWTINDFPAYGNLSGWKTKGYLACPHCNVDTCSHYLKKK